MTKDIEALTGADLTDFIAALRTMGFVDAASPVSGDILVFDGSVWALRPRFRGALVTKAADQVAANYSGSVIVAWDSESYDTNAIHDNVTNNSRLTVPTGVTKVRLQAQISLTANTGASDAVSEILKNGVATYVGYASTWCDVTQTNPRINISSPVLSVVATDYFELKLTTIDTSVNVEADESWFAMEIID